MDKSVAMNSVSSKLGAYTHTNVTGKWNNLPETMKRPLWSGTMLRYKLNYYFFNLNVCPSGLWIKWWMKYLSYPWPPKPCMIIYLKMGLLEEDSQPCVVYVEKLLTGPFSPLTFHEINLTCSLSILLWVLISLMDTNVSDNWKML